jgi:hypothetical protein
MARLIVSHRDVIDKWIQGLQQIPDEVQIDGRRLSSEDIYEGPNNGKMFKHQDTYVSKGGALSNEVLVRVTLKARARQSKGREL